MGMPELVYPTVITAAKTMFRTLDVRVEIEGAEHVPQHGGAVIACNHVSYVDFLYCGYAAVPSGRRVRFMCKKEIFGHWLGGPLMRGMRHIPVDRDSGLASYKEALAKLAAGEVVGLFPEATISQSFTVKEIKSGAARMAMAAGVPLIPVALWGTQRFWTKGRPKELGRRHVPVLVKVGKPLHPARRDNQHEVLEALRGSMSELLDRAQREYPDAPSGADDQWWLPAHLGGTAPRP